MNIYPNSTKNITLINHNGQWEFLKTSFGLYINPAAFNRYLVCEFGRLRTDGTLILYMDDFIVHAKTEEK